MEQHQYNEFSSKIMNVQELNANYVTNDDHLVFERMNTGGDVDDEIKFGEQLQDDLINSFCDKLQAACPRRIEAFLAIQFLMITDVADVRRHVTGKHSAIQVLYDRTRSHYVMVHYNPRYKHVEIYDSLQPFNEKGEPMILQDLANLISHLFGHLHTKYIPLLVDREFEAQSDNFSCGYRVVAAIVDLTRGKNPANYTYSRRAILELMRQVLNDPMPTWQVFESAIFGKEKQYSGHHRVKVSIENTTHVPSVSSSSTCSSRSSSTDSNVSRNSRDFRTSPSSRKPGRRPNAGRVPHPLPRKEAPTKPTPESSQEQYPLIDKVISFLSGNWPQNIFNQFFRIKSEDESEEEEYEEFSVLGIRY